DRQERRRADVDVRSQRRIREDQRGVSNMTMPATIRAAAAWRPSQFLSVLDLTPGELETCLELAASLKAARHAGRPHVKPLTGRHIALLFDKPSLRTRTTFMIALRQLGGDVIEPQADGALGG